MPAPLRLIDSSPSLPSTSDVVVIGAGIVGSFAAYYLAQRGLQVALVEKGVVGGEQSSRNWGWCRRMGRDAAEIPLSVEALRQWEGMDARLGEATGFRRAGVVYLHETPRQTAAHEAWLEHARPFQIESRLLTPDEVETLLPGTARRWTAGCTRRATGARNRRSRSRPWRARPAGTGRRAAA